MNELLEKAYTLMTNSEYEESLKIYKNILYSHIENDIGTKIRAIKECFILSQNYSPAKEILLSYKNSLLKKIKENSIINTDCLIEYYEICYLSSNDKEFLELFEYICKVDTESAQAVYTIVSKILINNKRWDLCNICISDAMNYSLKLLEQYDELIRISNSHFNGDYNKEYNFNICNQLQTLFWILKVGERDKESKKILSFIRKELLNRNIQCEE